MKELKKEIVNENNKLTQLKPIIKLEKQDILKSKNLMEGELDQF